MRSALDGVLPSWDARERHSIAVDAPPDRVFAAVREATLAEMPAARWLFRLRGLPAAPERSAFDQLEPGFRVLAELPGREIVVGSIAQPWRLRGGEVADADFRTFDKPGFAKLALSFLYEDGILSTETRVLLTDGRSRRRFGCYWRLIRPWSGLIRRSWLRAAKRRATTV